MGRPFLTMIPGSRAAIGAMLKCGFTLPDEGSEPGVIRCQRWWA